MDPPVYGHGPNGEVWDFNISFPKLLENCRKILIPNPVFVIVNAYAISASSLMLKNMLEDYLGAAQNEIEYGELVLEQKSNGRLLSTGIFARYCSI
jgi:23S rRNA (cytosine1962-C5)-methyltransferase